MLGSEELVDVLSRHKGMTALHLGLNGLTERGLQTVGLLLRVHRDLEYIDIWGNPGMGTPGAFAIIGPLTYSPVKLRTLNLSQCGLGAGVVPGLLSLASRGHLRALSVANNALGPQAGRLLPEALRFAIVALDFSDCGLGPRGIMPIAKLLRDAGPSSCCLLALSWNGIGPAGLEMVLEGSARHVSCGGSLRELYLRGNGLVTLPTAQYAQDLVAVGTAFERLDLSRNSVSPEANKWLRLSAPLEKMQLPERVATEAEGHVEDDAVYWRRLLAPKQQQQFAIEDRVEPALDIMPSESLPPRLRYQQELGADLLSPHRTCVPSHMLAKHNQVAISLDVPLRNRRNEAEAFEAFIVKRCRFNSPRTQHLASELRSNASQHLRGPGESQSLRIPEHAARFPRSSGSKVRRGLVRVKRPTTR